MVLFIDACVRSKSRTRELAMTLLERLGEYEHLKLYEEDLPGMDEELLEKRNKDTYLKQFEDDYYRYAKQFAEADEIVIAAPYWDLSFPAILKQYIEAICVTNLTFRYSEEGFPIGMCKAKRLHFVTTAGGPIFNKEHGFGYITTLAKGLLGIGECKYYAAENLDLYGSDVVAILNEVKEQITKEVL